MLLEELRESCKILTDVSENLSEEEKLLLNKKGVVSKLIDRKSVLASKMASFEKERAELLLNEKLNRNLSQLLLKNGDIKHDLDRFEEVSVRKTVEKQLERAEFYWRKVLEHAGESPKLEVKRLIEENKQLKTAACSVKRVLKSAVLSRSDGKKRFEGE